MADDYIFLNNNGIKYTPIIDNLWFVEDVLCAVDDSYSMYVFSPTFQEDADDLIAYWKRANCPYEN